MTTIRQLIQTSPVRANELFAKLVDTSDTAVKTRDRLFSELKLELDLQAELEEQHLFPVLKKHKETKGLVADALNDNRETRKLLAELERTPKDSKEFGDKVAELKKSFQQHVRDDKKDFLAAVVKALSDEEASTVVEKIEDEKAQIEAAQHAEADERRAEAKLEREHAEAADAAKDKAKADAARARKNTDAAQAKASAVARKSDDEKEQGKAARRADTQREVAEAERSTAADVVELGAKAAQQGAKVARLVTRAEADETLEMSKALRVATGSGAMQEVVREKATVSAGLSMVALLNEQARHAMQTTMAVGRARTLAEVSKAQSDFIGGSFQRMQKFNERYLLAFASGGTAS